MIFNLANYSYNNYQVTIYPVIEASLGALSSFANLEQLRVKTMSSPCFLAKSVIRLKKIQQKKD